MQIFKIGNLALIVQAVQRKRVLKWWTDDDGRTDAWAYMYYKLFCEPDGSGEPNGKHCWYGLVSFVSGRKDKYQFHA